MTGIQNPGEATGAPVAGQGGDAGRSYGQIVDLGAGLQTTATQTGAPRSAAPVADWFPAARGPVVGAPVNPVVNALMRRYQRPPWN